MENSQTSDSGRDAQLRHAQLRHAQLRHAQLRDNSEDDNTGSSQTEVRGRNNLFFRNNDGTFLATYMNPTLGRDVLHGLSLSGEPPSQVSAPPFAMAPSAAVDDDLDGDVQIQPLTAAASAQPSFPASDTNRVADVSSDESAPDPHTSSALSSTLRPNSSAGIVNANAWADRVFSSADGETYDRKWMLNHNVDKDILKGTPSKHKLNVLIKHGAVFVDDKLCATIPTVIEGQILPESNSTKLSVKVAPARGKNNGILIGRTLEDVKGPRDLVQGMKKVYPAQNNQMFPEGWKDVEVVSSDGTEIGTLFEVRQAYQVWTDEKAKWAARNARVGSA